MKKKKGRVWSLSNKEFSKLVANSNSVAEVCRNLGLSVTGKCHRDVKERIAADQIDADHIKLGLSSNKGRKFDRPAKLSLEEVLVENSSYDRKTLKKRLLKEGLLDNKCEWCGQLPTWKGNPLTLVLDHINGINNDNRLLNLRLLCPNCNSQTDTFSGRNNGKTPL